jgi:hypothetical protein
MGTWAVQGERRKAKGESKISADRKSFAFMMERLKGTMVQGRKGKTSLASCDRCLVNN